MSYSPEIEVFYDGHCPVCRWEVRLYSRMDKQQRIKWTDIEILSAHDLPAGKTREDLLGRFHVRDINPPQMSGATEPPWFIAVDAFARIWRVLPGLRRFAFIFSVPGIRQLAMVGYRVFLKWQSWHRRRR